jgi:hypothetical protein
MGNAMSQPEINPDILVPKPVLKPVIFSVLILVSGIIIGSGVTLMTADRFTKKPVPPGPEYLSKRMIERLIRELDLSPDQQEQVGPVVQQHMEAIEKVRIAARPLIAEEIKQMDVEIMALLDEKQKQIWNDESQRMQDNFPRDRQRRGSGNDPRDRDGQRDRDDPRDRDGQRDRNDPNFRPDDTRDQRRSRDSQPSENRERPEDPPPSETGRN